ncbi:uncharacterized protein LOC122860212 [Aphidius gifuensis]|uniref:uncharacterized protein LOC122860212 n=1 Tax=Aphidius gifuensis TaxID=684658 RepID=UPI001CDBE10A|nr:uncharacterized protein LOC122860212 [Aphidius gifuensis]
MYGFMIINNILLISLTGFETIMKMDQTDQAMRFAAFTFGQMVHLLFNSLPGQELVDHSTSVFNLAYDCQWESLSIKSKKKILFILMRSAKPKSLTVQILKYNLMYIVFLNYV